MDILKKKLGKKGGFTLVELLVVIAIIAILSVTAYVALGGQTGKARNSRRQSDLTAIQSALEIYFVENYSKYPDALLDDGGGDPELTPTYMPELPSDPIPGNDYVYDINATNKFYQLATVLEEDDGTYSAYVVGNSSTDLIQGVQQNDCSTPCTVADESVVCLPYCP